jgi:hypothetical protein
MRKIWQEATIVDVIAEAYEVISDLADQMREAFEALPEVLKGLGEMRATVPLSRQPIGDRGTRSPASPTAAHAPRAATRLPRRRAA